MINEYDIKTADDIHDALKDFLGGTIEKMLEAEKDNHLGYEPYERTSNSKGCKLITFRSKYGEFKIIHLEFAFIL